MKNYISIQYSIDFLTPFHCGTGLASGIVDRLVRKDANGYLIIPATTIKGVLREKLEKVISMFNKCDYFNESITMLFKPEEHLNFFRNVSMIDRILGSPVKEGELYIDDLKMNEISKELVTDNINSDKAANYLQTQNRTQIQIWRKLRTVAPKALFSSEYGNSHLSFTGTIKGHIDGVNIQLSPIHDLTYEVVLLLMALKMIDKIGGNKSIGMGAIKLTTDQIILNNKQIELSKILSDEIWENLPEKMYIEDLEAFQNEN